MWLSYVVCIPCARCLGGWCSCPGPGARPWQHSSTAARSSRNKPPRPTCPCAPDTGSLRGSFRCCPANRDSTLPVHRGRSSAMRDNPERDSLPSAPFHTDHSLSLYYTRMFKDPRCIKILEQILWSVVHSCLRVS